MTRQKYIRKPQKPKLDVRILLREDGVIEIDPQFNKLAVTHLDTLYLAADREDYDSEWSDDHKVAFFLSDMIDGVLVQWEPPETPDDYNLDAPVPHIRQTPVKDVFDIKDMNVAKL